MQLRFRTVFWSVAGLVVLALIVWAFWPRPVPADFAVVRRGEMVVSVRDEGYTRVREVYVVSAPLAGRVLRVDSEAGDRVEAGEVLANILASDPAMLDVRSRSEAEAALRSAEAALGFAAAQLEAARAEAELAAQEAERMEILAERGTISQAMLDRARTTLRRADAALATARANLRMRQAERDAAEARLIRPDAAPAGEGVVEVASPIDGQVLRVLQESEAVVQPGTPLVELGDPADLEIVAELLSTDAVRVEEGADALIHAWGGPVPLRAEVRRIEPFGFLKVSALGVEEQRVNVILDLLAPREEWMNLGHGYRVEPEIVTWRGEDVVIAPVASLFRHEGGWAAFRVEEGRARLTPVEMGRSNGREAQILSGLQPGDTLVLYPSDRIEDGAAVVPREG
ncbi:efflux RND transporter periplasmic adaptor subunit [Marinicauda algicola]|uniref:Efflux RND transporter periplasmic adaptor subunit n=1 Tax=Marinicauda algicola TaxID=2029849 RepID=A0A4S2H2I9_9PROT|nr:efflux RND transporter periplasmic adaptor subunit [Marinicauda algicola]TGY89807.1 efflux RND transporter periplasmic adaptor subunit [Marinicauda algicola]